MARSWFLHSRMDELDSELCFNTSYQFTILFSCYAKNVTVCRGAGRDVFVFKMTANRFERK